MINENDRFKIRPIMNNEWEEAMRLAWDTFLIFEAPDYSLRGVYNFKNFVRDPLLKKMYTYGEYIAIGAFIDERIVGILGVRNVNHVSLLFVDRDHHHQGIGTSLMNKYFADARREGITHVTVNASPYAVGFYHRIGFIDVKEEIEKDGIRFTPMRMEL
jgi:GNAT superfamily N-acetyltransferase